jgi:hypothetical protein
MATDKTITLKAREAPDVVAVVDYRTEALDVVGYAVDTDALRLHGVSRIRDNHRAVVLLFDRQLSDGDLRGVQEYLRAKWGGA